MKGFFGPFGGQYVPETLMSPLLELERAFNAIKKDPGFRRELAELLKEYAGRPTPLFCAQRASDALGFKVYLKREDLLHTGAHKINNTLGQGLLCRAMGKRRVIAETGAGQHGVATATVCALLGLSCTVYMGEEDTRRQKLNVFRMRALGAEVVPVTSGSRTLKDAMNEALRDWVTSVRHTHYIIGSVAGPHPYPTMVKYFQSVIGTEARKQILSAEGRLPHLAIACVGGGSNAMGLFSGFVRDKSVRLIGVEGRGEGLASRRHAATLARGKPGILHGSLSLLLQDGGQVQKTHSVAAGLDYPGVGPELSFLKQIGRLEVAGATDQEALEAFFWLAKLEGILPALEPAHAVAYLRRLKGRLTPDAVVLVGLSGRGDKDMETVMEAGARAI